MDLPQELCLEKDFVVRSRKPKVDIAGTALLRANLGVYPNPLELIRQVNL